MNGTRTFNVGFKGGIAAVDIIPTPEMMDLESKRDALLARAQVISNKIFELGQNAAYAQFKQKHPEISC